MFVLQAMGGWTQGAWGAWEFRRFRCAGDRSGEMGGQRQLTSQDVVFVGGETANIHQHTSGLTILDAAGRPDFGFETFRCHMVERLSRVPHLHWKLHEIPLGLDLPYWVQDEQFDFDKHIRRVGCPAPGDRKALAELVAYLYSRHLGRCGSSTAWRVISSRCSPSCTIR